MRSRRRSAISRRPRSSRPSTRVASTVIPSTRRASARTSRVAPPASFPCSSAIRFSLSRRSPSSFSSLPRASPSPAFTPSVRSPPHPPPPPTPPTPPPPAPPHTRRALGPPPPGRHSAPAAQPDQADVAGVGDVRAAAQLGGEVAHADHPDPVAVLVAEERERTRPDGVVVAHLLARHLGVGADPGVDVVLDGVQLVRADGLVVAEVEPQVRGIDQRARLLHVRTQPVP